MRLRTAAAATAVTLAMLLAGGAVSQAAITPSPSPDVAPRADDPVTQQLRELEGTQTPTEIRAIMTAPGPATALVDPATGEYLAAVATPPGVTVLSISPIYVGCGPARNACAWTNNGVSPVGFTGAGSLSIRLPSVTKTYAGSCTTTFWTSSTNGIYAAAYKTLTYTSPTKFIKITRGPSGC